MKQGIHPEYKECKVTCACGNTFMTKSTEAEIRTDICSACHPFFTGQQKFTQRGGRVEKFKNKYGLYELHILERNSARGTGRFALPGNTGRGSSRRDSHGGIFW